MRQQHASTRALVKVWGQDTPRAKVSHGTVPVGEHPGFAILGWLEQRKSGWPIVGLHLSLMDKELNGVIGNLTMGLPLSLRTERAVCNFLEELGWDGRIWPHKDHGWPEGGEDEQGLLNLLRTAQLGATLTFPPALEGTPTVNIPVHKSKGTYLLSPFSDGPVIVRQLEALRSLAANPQPFVSDWE